MWNSLLLAALVFPTATSEEPIMVALSPDAQANDAGCDILFEYERKSRILVEGKEYTIQAPPLAEGSLAGYGFLFFKGKTAGALGSRILFLVAGYDQDRALVFVDKNNDLDLTNDGPAIETDQIGSLLVSLHPVDRPDQRFTVRLRSHRDREKDAETWASVLEDEIERMGAKATKPKYWFSEERLNIVSADVKIGDLAFRLGVHDYNCNGNYSDRDFDRILVTKSGAAVFPKNLSQGATSLGEETLFRVENQIFEVVEIDPTGKFLKIKPSQKPYHRLAPGAMLPSLSIDLLHGQKRDLASYLEPDRYLLLDFWGVWCQPCIAAFPELKAFQKKWKEKVTILGLHFGDAESARKMIAKKGISWDQAVATKDLQERFLVDSWPYLVLVSPDGKILKLNTTLTRVEFTLRTGMVWD